MRTRDGPVDGLRRRERVVADARGTRCRLRHRAGTRAGRRTGRAAPVDRAAAVSAVQGPAPRRAWAARRRPWGRGRRRRAAAARRAGAGAAGAAAAPRSAGLAGALVASPLPRDLVGSPCPRPWSSDLSATLAGALSGAAGLLPPNASRSRRATGASTVDDADLTNSPCSFSRARTSLLVTPSSLANSCTRALPATTSPV